jgi:hypothetical protein
MTREQSDLLDVFRGKPARTGGARAVSRGSGERRRGEVVLSRAQVTLGGAVAGLLVLLAFMGGTAVGRHRTHDVALVREKDASSGARAPAYQFRSREMSRLAPDGSDLLSQSVDSFRSTYGSLAPGLSVIPAEDAKGHTKPNMFRLLVRGFQSRNDANNWLFQVKAWNVLGQYPFEFSVAEPVP